LCVAKPESMRQEGCIRSFFHQLQAVVRSEGKTFGTDLPAIATLQALAGGFHGSVFAFSYAATSARFRALSLGLFVPDFGFNSEIGEIRANFFSV